MVKIPVIFEIEGEAGFRKREEATIADLTALSNVVVATGGGAVLSAASREILQSRGVVVYLRGSPEHLYERTRRDRNRPLLQTPDPLARMREFYLLRDPLYREVADIIVDTGRQSVSNMTRVMCDRLDGLLSTLPETKTDHATNP